MRSSECESSIHPKSSLPVKGITAPVTATLDFHATNATLALRRPAKQPTAIVEGKVRPLAANFSAPISYYEPPGNLLLIGLMGALRSAHYEKKTGLYFLQPYDPDRIPVVFVHGLISTPFDWVKTINGLQADPEIRKRYQFWVFAYPTGNPVLYSALRLREELAKVDKLYPNHKDYVLVGHSMGGLLSQAQVTSMNRADWEKTLGEKANSSSSPRCNRRTLLPEPRLSRPTPASSESFSFVLLIVAAKWRQLGSANLHQVDIASGRPCHGNEERRSLSRTCAIEEINKAGSRTASVTLRRNPPYLAVLNKQQSRRPTTRSSVTAVSRDRSRTAVTASCLTGVLISMAPNPKSSFQGPTGHANCHKPLLSLTVFCA